MKNFDLKKNALIVIFILFALFNIKYAQAQRIYANAQETGASGILCLNCTVTSPNSAVDGNLQTFSTINVTLGVGALTYEDLKFPGTKPIAGTPVTVKLGTGSKLLTLTLLGNISLQAFDGTTAIGSPVAANTLLSAVTNDNQLEVSMTPQQAYDRIRVTLNGGLIGALSSIDVYEGFYTGTGAAACNTAIDEIHGVSGGLLGSAVNIGGVVNPQQSIDGNLTTAATLNAGVGLVGEATQQTIIYQNQSVIGDSIRLTLGIPQSLLNVGLLSNISVLTYNGNTSNNDQVTLSSPLLKVSLLGLIGAGNQKVVVTYAPAKVFDRVQLRLGGVANVLSTLDFYEAQRVIPAPVVKVNNIITNSAQICAGTSATLVATAVPNTTFNWYSAATGGSPIATGTTFNTLILNSSATYYVAAMRNGCTDESDRTKVNVTVSAIPLAPVITNNTVSVCSGQTATFTATSVAGVTINWYSAATGGTLLHTGDTFTTGPISQATSYYAEATTGTSCISPTRTQVTANITPPPALPVLTAPAVIICDGSVATLSINAPVAGVTYNWYTTVTGGTPVFTGNVYTTGVLHNDVSYYVEAVNAGGCTSAQRAQATVTVVPSPTDPVLAANNSTIVAGQKTTIGVTNTQTGVTYNWYTSANAATPIFTGTTFETPLLYNSTTYYVSAVNSTGCTSVNRTAITINVTINNNSPCTFANQFTNDVNGLCIGCSITNPALATDADTTTASTINVTAGLLGAYAQQELLFQQAGIAGDTIKLVLQNPGGLLNASVLNNIQAVLYNGATVVSTTPLDNSLIKVSLLPGNGNKYAVYIPATAAYDGIGIRINSTVTNVLTSLNVYYAVQQFPKPVFNPNSPEICKGSSAVINLTSPAAGTYNWYTTPTGGTSVHTGTSYTTDPLNANTTFYVEYTRGSCTGPVRFPVQVLVDDAPAAPTIAAQNVTVFSGQTATLNATASNGATIQWFTAATGGTPVFTGNPFITPALTSTQTYYAGTTLGSCVSTTRTPVTVTVQPIVIPDVTVTPPTATLSPGQTTSFTASSTTPGAVFNWYTAPTGGTSIFTGATYTTPPQFANNVYYAEATIPSTGAVSATRGTGTVTIDQQAANPVPCDAAIDQTNTTSGLLCIGCAINNATGSVDNDRNTFAQLNVPVGLVNSYASQTLRFANPGLAGDSVVIELGTPAALASVGVLSQISISTYNGATPNNDSFNVNGSLLSVNLLNGTSRFRVAFKALNNFDRVEVRLNASLAGVFSSLNIYDASQEVAAPVISATPAVTCEGTQATITATAPANVTIKWYTAATGGSPIFTGAVFTTPVLNATTTFYAEASRTADGCTQAVRTPAVVTVTPTPDAPVVTAPNVTVCSGSAATFNVQPVAGVTYSWFTQPTGGTALATGNNYTTDPLTNNAVYYVEATSGGQCSSSTRTKVTAIVTTSPSDATVTPASAQICSGSSTVLTASSSQTGVTFNWYTAATGGTPIFTGAQFTTPALTQNTSYYVEVVNGSCVSANRTRADVTVNPAPDAPTVVMTTPTGGQITSGQTAQLSATSTTANVTFNWYTSASGGTPIHSGATFTTPALSTNTTYYVEAVSNTTGCISTVRTPITVIVNPVFSTSCDFASSQTNSVSSVLCLLCGVTNGDNAINTDTTDYSQLNIGVGAVGYVAQKLIFADNGLAGDTVTVKIQVPQSLATVGLLSQLSIGSFNGNTDNNDRITLDNSLIKIMILPGGQAALFKFVPQQAFNAVEIRLNATLAVLNSLNVYYASKQVPAPQLASNTVNICSGGNATFNVSNPVAGVTYTWYNQPSGGTVLGTGTSYTATGINATTNFYVEASRTATGCANPNRAMATVNVTPSPVNPILAQNPVSICAGDQVTLSVTNAAGATVRWYDAASGGTLLFTGADYVVSPIATLNYYVELNNGNCNSPARTSVTVTVNPRPAAPAVESANVLVCLNSPATLKVLNPVAGVNYEWFTTPTGGTATHVGDTFVTAAITASTTYYVQATDGTSGCSNNGNRTAVQISVTNPVTAPVLSATSTTVCAGGSATISVVNPVNGIQYVWYTTATGGTAVFTGTVFTVNNLTANATYFVEAVNSNGCTSPTRTQTDIVVQPIPPAPQVQANAGGLNVCEGSSVSLSIVNPQADVVYRWYTQATGGTLVYTGTQFNTPPLTGVTNYFVEASQAGNCNPSTRTQVTVTINPTPIDPVLVTANLQVCEGSPATFRIQSPQAGVTYQWFDSPSQNNKLAEGTTFVTGPIFANTTYYIAAVNASGCQSANLTTAQVTVQAPPSAPMLVNNNITVCSGTQGTLTILNPQPGFTYNWYTTVNGVTPIYTGTSFNTPLPGANAIYYVSAVNITGCESAARTTATVTVSPTPPAPVVTAPPAALCAGNTVVLTSNNVDPTVTINWYTAATGGTAVGTGNSFTTPILNTTTTYYAEATNASGCSVGTRTPVTVTINPIPNDPALVTTNVQVCTGSPATLTIQSPQAGVTYQWFDSPSKTNKLSEGTTYVTGPLFANATYYVSAVNASGCQSANTVTVQVTVQAPPSAPLLVNSNVTACIGAQGILTILNPQAGFTYNWYTNAAGGSPVYTGTSFTTPVLNGSATYYVTAVNSTGCESAARTTATVTVTPTPPAPGVTVPGGSICPNTIATLTSNNNDPAVTIKWFATATGGTVLATGNSFTTPALTTTTTYYAEAFNAGGCSTGVRTAATVNVLTALAAPVVVVSDAQPTSLTFTWGAISGALSYEVSTDNGTTFTSVGTNLSYTVSGLKPLTSVTVIVRAIGATPCQSSANSAAVTGTTTNPQGDDIFVPNAFTPNGDGNNDTFRAYGNNIKTITLSVYDQWGELLFRSQSLTAGWDGTYKGTAQPVGVYVYYIDAVLNDGKKVQMKGTVNLLR